MALSSESGAGGRGRASRDFSVEVSDSLDQARPQWAALDDEALPFQRLAWLAPWYEIVAPRHGARPVFVTVRDAATGRPLLFLPLCLRRWRGLRLIQFAGFGVSDYNAPLLAQGFEPSRAELDRLWPRILRALPAADLVRFERVPERILGRAIAFARLGWLRPMDLAAWMLELPGSAPDYETHILSAKTRKENRRKTRRLQEKAGDFQLEPARATETADAYLEALRRQRGARFGADNNLDHPCFLAFYRAVIHGHLNTLAEVWALKAGERILATHLALRGPRGYLLIMHGFDATLDGGAAGIVALDQMIRRRIALGDRYFDFTIGNESYKQQFGVKRVMLHEGFYPASPLGAAAILAHSALKCGCEAFAALRQRANAR